MKTADEERIRWMTEENARRRRERAVEFDPVTGLGSVGARFAVDTPGGRLWLPESMKGEPVVALMRGGREYTPAALDAARMRHDFPYWAATRARIKPKGGGGEVMFTLNRPQRMLVERLEEMRLASRPLRLILLKARQWGGSTCVQLYMAWLQLVHERGLNSLIIAHQGSASEEIRDMFDRLMRSYPPELLDEEGAPLKKGERILSNVGTSRAAVRVARRDCKIKVGTAERPDSCRGGDYNLVHLSEVGMWKRTLGKRPEDIVRSACSGVLDRPMTMIVYESTANGTGNFFHREYEAAKRGESQFSPFFVAWHDIEQYALPVADPASFARRLLERRGEKESLSDRSEPGEYLWWLWERGATFEGIAWYEHERRKYSDHGQMASEYPSDDVEAFVHSGARVFDRYRVEALRPGCTAPRARGEVSGAAPWGKEALKDVRFAADGCGGLLVWDFPDVEEDYTVSDRYLAVVDIGGRSARSDWSVIVVFDRYPMVRGEGMRVAAQWRGHCDMDLLAWKAAAIAAFYGNALLVVESNTVETRDRERSLEGDQSGFLLCQLREAYPNLYARRGAEEAVAQGMPRRYGFHTNMSTKPMIISTLVRAVREGLYEERDENCLDEYLTYERRPDGSYGAIAGRHDDMLMTRAIGLHISFFEMPVPVRRMKGANAARRRLPLGEASFF